MPDVDLFSYDVLERSFVRHYLRSDGPFGAEPLRYLDATPRQLANALSAREDDVIERLLGSYRNRRALVDALSWGAVPRASSADEPGYFHYLVLTCLIASVSDELSRSGNFRLRLQELLGLTSPIMHLSGVAKLWARLVRWSDLARSKGYELRRVILPDPGTYSQIGYALRIAFPSRRDRERFRAVSHSHRNWDDPGVVIRATSQVLDKYPWSTAFRSSFLEFERRFHAGDRLLADHAFWRFAVEENGDIRATSKDSSSYMRLLFGWDQEPQVELVSESAVGDRTDWTYIAEFGYVQTGDFEQTLEKLVDHASQFHGSLRSAASQAVRGLIALCEDQWGSLRCVDDVGGPTLRLILHSRWQQVVAAECKWTRLSASWSISDEITAEQYLRLLSALGFHHPPMAYLKRLTVEGGIRTHAGYLGRHTLLPTVNAQSTALVAIEPDFETEGELEVKERVSDRLILRSSPRVSGIWRVSAQVEKMAAPSEVRIRFCKRALLHPTLAQPDQDSWRPDVELISLSPVPVVELPLKVHRHDQISEDMSDLLEAVYAKGQSGWSEADLLGLFGRTLGARFADGWNVLRSLRDSGWLTAYKAKRWKVRRWYLVAPHLIEHQSCVLLSGAASEIAREQFRSVVSRIGGQVVEAETLSPWAIPLPIARSVSARQLANELKLICVPAQYQEFKSAPNCWPEVKVSRDRRELASRWCWHSGRFENDYRRDGKVGIERWVRPQADASDLYRVTLPQNRSKTYESRLVAVLEAHRQSGVSLFLRRGSWLVSKSAEGRLPDCAVDRLRLRHLVNPQLRFGGPTGTEYLYPIDDSDMAWLSSRFGAALFSEKKINEVPWRRTSRGAKLFRLSLSDRGGR